MQRTTSYLGRQGLQMYMQATEHRVYEWFHLEQALLQMHKRRPLMMGIGEDLHDFIYSPSIHVPVPRDKPPPNIMIFLDFIQPPNFQEKNFFINFFKYLKVYIPP